MAGPVTHRSVPPFRAVHALMTRASMAGQRQHGAEALRLKQGAQLMSKVASAQLRDRIHADNRFKTMGFHGPERGRNGEAK